MKKVEFECTAVLPEQYPKKGYPEIALLGRSNVGKSSFINTILNRKNIARVGSKPGKTRVINFFNVDDFMYIVDLPGYGYAKVSKDKKNKWQELIEEYLFNRKEIKLLVLIVDIRHEPSEDDKIMYNWIMSRNVRYIIVANKLDKISRNYISKNLSIIKKSFGFNEDVEIIPFSAKTKVGKEEIWNSILNEIESKIDRR